MPAYDVIIIGSGLGGLLCGTMLSREGLRVCVLEKHAQPGGCLQNFTRNGVFFDTGIHYIGSLDEGQILNRYFRYFGVLDKIRLKRLDSDGYERITFSGDPTEYRFANGKEGFVESLAQHFPHERANLKRYIARLEEVTEKFPLFTLAPKSAENNEAGVYGENAREVIASVIRDPKLQQVLAGNNPLYAGTGASTPFYVHGLINYSLMESAYRIVDGSGTLTDALCAMIRSNGGEVRTGAEVMKLRLAGGQVSAVELAGGELLETHRVVGAIHPASVMQMLPDGAVRKAYSNRIQQLRNTISSFSLYIVFKPASFPYLNYNLYHHNQPDVWDAVHYDRSTGPENFLLLMPVSSETKQWGESVFAMMYMDYDEVKKWEGTEQGRRGDEYRDFMELKARQMLAMIEKRIPGFNQHVHRYYTSSPLTYRDYTGIPEGSLYGILRDSSAPVQTLISPRTKIPNLFLTGQNIIMHGALGVTIAAVSTCAEMLGYPYLVEKIKAGS